MKKPLRTGSERITTPAVPQKQRGKKLQERRPANKKSHGRKKHGRQKDSDKEKRRRTMKCTPNIGRISICLDGMSSVLYRAHVV